MTRGLRRVDVRAFPLLAIALFVVAPIASASWASLNFVGGDQRCLVPTGIAQACLHWGMSGNVHATACDATDNCSITYNVQAAVSSMDPTPRTVTLTLDNATACESSGTDQWIACRAMGILIHPLLPGACGNMEFHVSGAYGAQPVTRQPGIYGGSPYPRPDYGTIVYCRNATTSEVDNITLVRVTTLT